MSSLSGECTEKIPDERNWRWEHFQRGEIRAVAVGNRARHMQGGRRGGLTSSRSREMEAA